MAVEAKLSYIMSEIKRLKGYGENLTEFGDCDSQIAVTCSGGYRKSYPFRLEGCVAFVQSYLVNSGLEGFVLFCFYQHRNTSTRVSNKKI